MKINYVSSVSFGKNAFTKNGNEYEKTNKYKIIGSGVGVANAALTLSFPKILSHVFKYPMEGVFSKKFLYLNSLLVLAAGIGGGVLIDAVKNKNRARKADGLVK